MKSNATQQKSSSATAAEALCRYCGLCCQGIFHSRADILDKADVDVLRRIPARIIEDEGEQPLFSLPCPAHRGDCSIFPDRPRVCTEHRCDLLNEVISGNLGYPEAATIVDEMRALLVDLLPKIWSIAGNKASNQAEQVLYSALEATEGSEARLAFKSRHQHTLKLLGQFKLLKHKYFYPPDDQGVLREQASRPNE